MITKNDDGNYALYDKGKLIGYEAVKYIDNVRVVESMYDRLMHLKDTALTDGIKLTLAAGLRSWSEQINLRIKNVIDKSKANDIDYLTNASSDKFMPVTGKPGWSNHQDGKAYDFNVTGYPNVYAWLVKNAGIFGFVRTVLSERWHWEYIPGASKFDYVPKTHYTWDGLV
jgi:LAS superfamily LD-carboxypeptidase LdcB